MLQVEVDQVGLHFGRIGLIHLSVGGREIHQRAVARGQPIFGRDRSGKMRRAGERLALLRGLDQRYSAGDRALPILAQAGSVERLLVGVFVDDETRVAGGHTLRRLASAGGDLNFTVCKDEGSARNLRVALFAFELEDPWGSRRSGAKRSAP